MGYEININGCIQGISKDSFELIKEDLEDVFSEVSWNENAIEIYSYGNHHDEVMHPVYNKIGFCIDGDSGGQLDIEGEECGDFSTIFFVPRQWKQVWGEFVYPKDPFIKKSINITYSKTAYIPVNPSIMDKIKNELNGWANGDENVCIVKDDLKNWLATKEIDNKEIYHFIKTVQNEVIEDVGDIVFHI